MSAYIDARIDNDNATENEAENAENQKQAKINLPSPGNSLRLVKIKVIRQKQGENGKSQDFYDPVFIKQGNVSIQPEQISSCQDKRSSYEESFA
jgi:hypothetical protein